MTYLTTKTPSPWREFQTEFPDVAKAYRRVLNKHFVMAADEHREGASDSSVKRHDDEYNAAEKEFLAVLMPRLRTPQQVAPRDTSWDHTEG